VTTTDELKDKAQGFIIGQIGAGSKQFGGLLKDKAKSIRTVGGALRERGETGPGQVADMAAERLERVAKYFSKADGEHLVSDLENLARKNPLLTVGAGLTVGVFAARLLKASAGRRKKRKV
jgi:hypothetical protein